MVAKVTANKKGPALRASPMKTVTPYLIIAAIAVGMIALVFRAAPTSLRKVIVGA